MADHVVSMPAMISSAMVPTMCWSLERLAVDLGVEQEADEVVLRFDAVLRRSAGDVVDASVSSGSIGRRSGRPSR